MQYQLLNIKTVYGEEASMGGLSILEAERDVPFAIKRVYYIHGVAAGEERGFHAHKELRQILICPNGKIKIMLDDGKEKAYIMLDDPTKALLVEPRFWHTMQWEESDSVLMVLASGYYNAKDYIRDYSEFLAYYNVETEETV